MIKHQQAIDDAINGILAQPANQVNDVEVQSNQANIVEVQSNQAASQQGGHRRMLAVETTV